MNRILVIPLLCSVVLLGLGITGASAQDNTSQRTVCLYSPIDLFMDPGLLQVVRNEINKFNVTVITESIPQQVLTDQSGCNVIVKIERSINENYGYTDHATRFQISQNILTIFAYKDTVPFNPNAQPMHAMLNWNCELQAHESKYFSNYHISNQGYFNTYRGYCDPYHMQNPEKIGELAPSAIKKSVASGLEKLLQ